MGIYRMLPVTSHVHCVPTLSWLDVTWKLTCVKSVLKRWPLRLRREQVAIEIKTLSKTKAGAPSSGKHWLWHAISFYSHHPSFVLLLVVQFICLQRASHIVGSLEKVFSLFPVHQGWKPTVFWLFLILDQIILSLHSFVFHLYHQGQPQYDGHVLVNGAV